MILLEGYSRIKSQNFTASSFCKIDPWTQRTTFIDND